MVDGDYKRRFDIVLYFNGMPVSFIELKKAGDDSDADVAHDQLRPTSGVPAGVPMHCGRARLGRDQRHVRHRRYPVGPLRAVERRRRRRARQQPPVEMTDLPLVLLLYGLFKPARFIELLHGYVSVRRGPRRAGQADRQAAPVLRRDQGGRQHHPGGGSNGQGRRRLAHPGVGQVDGDGALREPGDPAPEADATRPSSSSPTATSWTASCTTASRSASCCPSSRSRSATRDRTAGRADQPADRRHLLHHAAEVRPHQGRAGGRRRRTRCCPTGGTSS